MSTWNEEVERETIHRSRKDPRMFSGIYNQYYERIAFLIYSKVEAVEVAKDITSTTFIKALEKLSTFDEKKGRFFSWIYAIALNEVRMHFRKTRKEVFLFSFESIEEELAFTSEEYPDDLKSDLDHALKSLPEEELNLLELRYGQGLTYQEIGELQNLTRDAAKVRVYRLLKKLRTTLKK